MRCLQELLPYCPQFYTHNIGKEILAELKTTGHGTDKDVEMNIPQTQKEPIELKIPHIISHARYVCSRFDEVSMTGPSWLRLYGTFYL